MRRHRIPAIALSAALLVVAAQCLALASPLSEKRAEAAHVQAQIDSLNDKVEIAAEAYNQAGEKLHRIERRIKTNNQRLKALQARLDQVQDRLRDRAANMYQSGGPLAFLEVIGGSSSFEEFTQNWDLMTDMSQNDATLATSVKDTRAQARTAGAQLASDRKAAKAQVALRAGQRRSVERRLTQRRQLLASVNSDIRRIMAEEAARAAAAAREAAARAAAESSGGGDTYNGPAPTIPAHGNVVDYARSRIGLPYEWAAAGPNSFDCSGLMMWSYARIGISLPHSSRDQINVGQRVARKDLKPGDLVFFGSPIHHVGMYIGNGEMIEAPYTGASVRIRSAFRDDYAGACRP